MEWYENYYNDLNKAVLDNDEKKINRLIKEGTMKNKINWLNVAIEIAKVIIAALAGLTAGTQLL